jgi:hypothetical protein
MLKIIADTEWEQQFISATLFLYKYMILSSFRSAVNNLFHMQAYFIFNASSFRVISI